MSSDNQVPGCEPPWSGWIETTGDALIILEAARRGLIPRVTRRLVDAERKMITSGSVFVFDEDESGIKRWTDGFFWSPSRILGNFLLYRETEKRGSSHRGPRQEVDQSGDPQADGSRSDVQTLSRPRSDSARMGIDRSRERSLVGSLTNTYKFKAGGMMKKTFSLTIGGVSQHLISYYKVEDIEQGRLRSPSSYPELASLDISPEYLDKTHFRNPPKVEIGVDGVPRYRGEADEAEPSPHALDIAIASGIPLLSEPTDVGASAGKRGKRYDPYGAPSRRSRKGKNAQDESSSPTDASPYPVGQGYDPNMAMMQQPHYVAYGVSPYSYQIPPGYMPPPHGVYYPPPAASPPPASPQTTTAAQSDAIPSTAAGPTSGYPPYGPSPGTADQSQQTAYYQYYSAGYQSYWPQAYGYTPSQPTALPEEALESADVEQAAPQPIVDSMLASGGELKAIDEVSTQEV
ncbi:Gti1/Pac2 family-domain-containing protein [Amylostereum chailletii]|nr:Gti1/Pac2 family-domain-containing protein [Amylostereum chailletii]